MASAVVGCIVGLQFRANGHGLVGLERQFSQDVARTMNIIVFLVHFSIYFQTKNRIQKKDILFA